MPVNPNAFAVPVDQNITLMGGGWARQGWCRPKNSKRIHYVLNGRSLCRHWVIATAFYRLFDGTYALNSAFVLSQKGSRKLCSDCVRYYIQKNDNFQIPVEPPPHRRRHHA